MDNKYFTYIAAQELSTYHYKILLLLLNQPLTQSQLGTMLGLQKQNVYKYVKHLESMNLVEVDRIEGKNKFYHSITNIDRLLTYVPGQQKFDF